MIPHHRIPCCDQEDCRPIKIHPMRTSTGLLLVLGISTTSEALLSPSRTLLHRPLLGRSILRMSNEEKSDASSGSASTEGKAKNSFIDLFAAGDRKTPIQTPSPTLASSSGTANASATGTVMAPPKPAPVATDSTTTATTTAPASTAPPTTPPSATASRNTNIELQAELLRLEAEKEQLEVDQLRLEGEKRRLVEVDALIVKLIEGSTTLEKAVTTQRPLIRKELFFRIAELANAALTTDERSKYATLCDTLMDVVQKTDSLLHAELTAEIQKELNLELNRLRSGLKNKDTENAKVYEQVLQQWIQTTVNGTGDVTQGQGQGQEPSSTFDVGMGMAPIFLPVTGPGNGTTPFG